MKIRQYKTSSVGWALAYNESKVENQSAARIGGNVAGDIKTLEKVFNHVAYQRETANLMNRFSHLKISLSPADHEVSSATFRKVVSSVLVGLGLDQSPMIIYRHYDTKHPHVHVIVSRISFDGHLVRDSYDGLKSKRLEREVAIELNLTPSYHRLLSPLGIRLAQRAEIQRSAVTGEKSVRNYIQCAVIESLQEMPDLETFLKRLRRRGVTMWHREFKRGESTYHGLSYTAMPDLQVASFQSRQPALAGGITAAQLGGMSTGEAIEFDHAYFGSVTGTVHVNRRGVPEFCMGSIRPIECLQAYSFRASSLGPFFQFDSITRALRGVDANTLASITVTPQGLPQQDDYPLVKTADNPFVEAILYAAEMRSTGRIIEVLAKGGDEHLEKAWLAALAPDAAFIESSTMAQEINLPEREFLRTLGNRLEAFTGRRADSATLQVLEMIGLDDWNAVHALALRIMDGGADEKPFDPAVMYLDAPPEVALTLIEYQAWHAGQPGVVPESNPSRRNEVNHNNTGTAEAVPEINASLLDAVLVARVPDISKTKTGNTNEVDTEMDDAVRRVDEKDVRHKNNGESSQHQKPNLPDGLGEDLNFRR